MALRKVHVRQSIASIRREIQRAATAQFKQAKKEREAALVREIAERNAVTTEQQAFQLRGLDTETQNGTLVLIATPYRFAEPRSFEACVAWLRCEKKYICWNANFDIQAIIKFLPFDEQSRLYHFGSVTYKAFRIRYRKSKYLTVSERTWITEKSGKRKRRSRLLFSVYDLKQFYATSLEKTAQKLLHEGKDDIPKTWLENMAIRLLDPRTRSKVIRYCMKDALRCEQIAKITWDNFARIGIKFDRPVSNAALAVQKFKRQIKEMKCPLEINQWARRSYRGGRIECVKIGYFPEAWYYDIHSAYPSATLKLLKLDGDWIACNTSAEHPGIDANSLGPSDDAVYAVVDAVIEIPSDLYLCPVPLVTRDFPLIYPYGLWKTTLDLTTFRFLASRGLVRKVLRGMQMVGGSHELMFPEMADMYAARLADKTNAWAIKIVMNSLYGKFAQVMERWKRSRIAGPECEFINGEYYRRVEVFPKFTNFVLASAITADIRRRLYEEVPHRDLIFAATDGVMLTRPTLPDNVQGAGLGEWETAEKVRDLIVVGSGMYSYVTTDKDTGEDKRVTKMRGFDVSLDLVKALDTPRRTVKFKVRRNVTLAQAIQAGSSRDMNEILELPRELDLNFDRKRLWERTRTGRGILSGRVDSAPLEYAGKVKITL